MSVVPTKVGADPKRLVILGGLLVVLVVVYLLNRTPDSGAPSSQAASSSPADPAPLKRLPPVTPSGPPLPAQRQSARRGEAAIQDFKPSLKLPDGADVSRIDPTLKLDLLAKLQDVPLEGGERSLFDFGAPPKPKTPPPPVQPIKPLTPSPAVTVSADPPAPVKPALPPIPLKFYGYVSPSQRGSRQAFFLDGDDIFVAGENDVIRNRYKVIRIGVNSAVVEDTTNKNQQTLPLIEELQG
jgi:hypothetical protein